MWLNVGDALAGSIYRVSLLEETRFIQQPRGSWYEFVGRTAKAWRQTLEPYGVPSIPVMIPWHRREWMYDPLRKAIYYSDLEGQPEEIVPIQANLLGESSDARTLDLLQRTAPAVAAHELFHYWRDVSERMTEGAWTEERAVNRLTAAYLVRYDPSVLEAVQEAVNRILATHGRNMSERATQLLAWLCEVDGSSGEPGDIPWEEAAVVHAALVHRLIREPLDFDTEVSRFLR